MALLARDSFALNSVQVSLRNYLEMKYPLLYN